jgi:amidase
MDLDIATATAAELSRAIRTRVISSRELLDQLVARAERLNPALNAIVAWDLDRARTAATAADHATAQGQETGPLHGMPATGRRTTTSTAGLTIRGIPARPRAARRAALLLPWRRGSRR